MPTSVKPHMCRYLKRLRRQQQLAPNIILHYDPESRDLRAWFWPVGQTGERITPTDLEDHRITHQFRAPCCLCACRGNADATFYTECAIYRAVQGPYIGKYVASCVSASCGYLICIEKMYPKSGLFLAAYPIRSANALAPVPVVYGPYSNVFANAQRDRNADITDILLLRLDSWTNPGLSEIEFDKVIGKCPQCQRRMTCRVFKKHTCEIIDLTGDSD